MFFFQSNFQEVLKTIEISYIRHGEYLPEVSEQFDEANLLLESDKLQFCVISQQFDKSPSIRVR